MYKPSPVNVVKVMAKGREKERKKKSKREEAKDFIGSERLCFVIAPSLRRLKKLESVLVSFFVHTTPMAFCKSGDKHSLLVAVVLLHNQKHQQGLPHMLAIDWDEALFVWESIDAGISHSLKVNSAIHAPGCLC